MSLKKTYLALVMLFSVFGVCGLFAAPNTVNLQTLVLDDFEMDGEDSDTPKVFWKLLPNTFGREGNRPNGKSMQRIAWVKAWRLISETKVHSSSEQMKKMKQLRLDTLIIRVIVLA